ncbi:C-type lectin domain family 2 member B-like [Petaurus breviceps papuanus]|uniref:C-type lectin domain family 2 member B-like n=1 Tax=Petaurus breviceps papuanus TaxID=3040969 RepID=UPI0036D8D97D
MNTEDCDEEYNIKDEELIEEEGKEETRKQEEDPQRFVWIGRLPKRVIYSTVAGGGFILVLVIAISISKNLGKNTDITSEDKFCPSGSPVCPKGWFRAFHKCYYLSADQKSWNASQKICRSFGANLAIFGSLEEMEFLMKRIGSSQYWLGLINDAGTSSWTWIDGTLPSFWLLIEGAGCARLSQRGISSDSCKSSRNFMCSREDKCA